MSRPRHEYGFDVGATGDGQRLDRFVSDRLPWRSRGQCQLLILSGRVVLVTASGSPSRFRKLRRSLSPATRLRRGDRLLLLLDAPFREQPLALVTDAPLPVVYDDEALLAIDKPPGMNVYPTRRHRSGSLLEQVHRCWQESGRFLPSPCHRLDRETSGVLLLAKDPESRAAVGQQFEERRIRKTYHAWVVGVPQSEGRIDLPLAAAAADSRVRLKSVSRPDGRPARTYYRVVRSRGGRSLLELEPETGRQHQLRAHLAAIGHPILGDKLYLGGDELFLASLERELSESELSALGHDRLALHASRLVLLHPVSRSEIVIEAPMPRDLSDL